MSSKNLIYKDNKIIEASYKLTLTEQRIVLLAISQVNSSKKLTENDVFTLSAEEYSTVFSITKDEAFREMKKAMKDLFNRCVKVIDDGDIYDEIRWISKKSATLSNQSIAIRFTVDIAEYLSCLEGSFTKYKLQHISRMNSVYSIRIYELLMQWKTKKTITMTIEQLKDRLQLTSKSYAAFGSIKQKVIDPAVLEITQCSDIVVNYDLIKAGKKVVSVKFYYNFKPGFDQKTDIRLDALDAIKQIKGRLKQ